LPVFAPEPAALSRTKSLAAGVPQSMVAVVVGQISALSVGPLPL
jgi:hypothetical protein